MPSPPEKSCLVLSLRVRSGLIRSQVWPPSFDAVHVLRRRVDDVRVERRQPDRRVPLEAVLHVQRALPGLRVRVDAHVLVDTARCDRCALERAAVVAGVDDVRVARIDRDVAGLAGAGADERLAHVGARRRRSLPLSCCAPYTQYGPAACPPRCGRSPPSAGCPASTRSRRRRAMTAAPPSFEFDHRLVVRRVDPQIVVVAVRALDAASKVLPPSVDLNAPVLSA